jgi:hypothetical protein
MVSGGYQAQYRNALIRAGLAGRVQALDAASLKTRETEADITLKGANAKKAGVDAEKDQFAIASQRIDIAGKAFGFVRDNPSAENAQRVVQSLMQGGIWNQQQAEKAMAEIQANPTPEAIKALATQAFQATLSAKDQLSQLFNQNRGGTFAVQAVNPVTMQATDVSSAPITQSADNAASNLTSTENNKRSTGATYAIAAAGRAQAAATRDAASITAKSKAAQDAEMKLADDYRTESKGWAETATAIGMVREALKTADKNPGSALAAGTKFMKLLDPTSVVRETELGMALNASGWFDRATNVANQLQSGRVMTKEQVKNLGAAGDALYEEARKAQLQIDAAFEARAKAYGANPANVITDRGQRSPRNAPAPAADGWGAVKVN